MGEVYRAEDLELKRQVALKLLPPAMARDPQRLERFSARGRSDRGVESSEYRHALCHRIGGDGR